jgi:hypothetical protein
VFCVQPNNGTASKINKSDFIFILRDIYQKYQGVKLADHRLTEGIKLPGIVKGKCEKITWYTLTMQKH